MSRHFDDYVKAFKKVGERVFSRELGADVIIGLRVIGDLSEDGQRGEAQTFLAALHDKDQQAVSLHRRVWPIAKSKYGPPTSYIRLGRSSDNDMIVPDYSISQVHCAFRKDPERGLLIADIESHNGTRINDQLLAPNTPTALEDQDELILGRYLFEYLKAETFIMRLSHASALS